MRNRLDALFRGRLGFAIISGMFLWFLVGMKHLPPSFPFEITWIKVGVVWVIGTGVAWLLYWIIEF